MKTMINLLPQSFRRQQILRKRITQWTTIISVVLVSGWGWHWWEMQEDRQLTQQLDTLSREHAPTRTMLKQLVEMRQQLVELQQQEAVAKELDCQRNALTLLGAVSEAARKTKGRLRITKFDVDNFQGNSNSSDPALVAKPPGVLLDGVALDNSSVAQMLNDLKESGIFSRVELLSLKERENKDAALRDYQIKCEF